MTSKSLLELYYDNYTNFFTFGNWLIKNTPKLKRYILSYEIIVFIVKAAVLQMLKKNDTQIMFSGEIYYY